MIGEVSLIHSLSSVLPPPGYSKERPHAFVLTQANGGSYFFQAGTEDLVQEWVSTCNYWSARLSKEPLAGGIGNVEYGWNKVDLNSVTNSHSGQDFLNASVGLEKEEEEDMASIRSGKSGKSKKSNRDHYNYSPVMGGGITNPNDRIVISDWKPPLAPAVASTVSEDAQLEGLNKHVRVLQKELQNHNRLRSPMMKLVSDYFFSPSHYLTFFFSVC
jgi:PH and SEC7 domain-containing protein